MGKRLRYSRFRRLPGIFRIGESKPADPGLDEQRLTLYLPARILDQAEEQAARLGFETVQSYCQHLLQRSIEQEHARAVMEETEARRGPLEGLHEVANDPEYLVEWSALATARERPAPPRGGWAPAGPQPDHEAMPESNPTEPVPTLAEAPGAAEAPDASQAIVAAAASVVLKHAALAGDFPSGLLPTLRRREPVEPQSAQALLASLRTLEVAYRGATTLDRRLAYALHRLAFEGQVLLTDGWSDLAPDEATIDIMRIVQEAVDRVLSGEDIRYFAREAEPEPPP